MCDQVCSREFEVSSVFSCQWLLDVRGDTVGNVQLWRRAMDWTEWHSGTMCCPTWLLNMLEINLLRVRCSAAFKHRVLSQSHFEIDATTEIQMLKWSLALSIICVLKGFLLNIFTKRRTFCFDFTGVVICLGRGAYMHIAQLMPLPLTISCFSKIQIGSGIGSSR